MFRLRTCSRVINLFIPRSSITCIRDSFLCFFSNSVHVACSRMFLSTSSISFCYFFDFVTQFRRKTRFFVLSYHIAKLSSRMCLRLFNERDKNIRVCLFTHGAKRHAPRVFQPQIRSGCIFIFFLQTNVIFFIFYIFYVIFSE